VIVIEACSKLYSYIDDRGYLAFGLPGSLPQTIEQRRPISVASNGITMVIPSPLDERANDPRPLYRGEVFRGDAKQPSDVDGVVKLTLRGIRMDTRCTDTVWGPELRALVQNGGCDQVVRGLYTDQGTRWIGQVTIFNMHDASASRSLVTRIESQHDAGFVFPLTGSGPLDRLGRGYSEGWAGVYGHYVLLTWSQRTDGTKPSEHDTDLSSVDFALERVQDVLIHRENEAA
jgi:hypothetical protein